jgi:2-octaprenylphenol hydroxylase
MASFDVAVVGGGMVGLGFALDAADRGMRVAVVEGSEPEPLDNAEPALRVSAISHGSQHIFSHLGVWERIQQQRNQAYTGMEVWSKDSFGRIVFNAGQQGVANLGHIIENRVIRAALWQAAQAHEQIELIAPVRVERVHIGEREALLMLDNGDPLIAQLLVAADGANSWLRGQANIPLTQWDYDHHAMVATIKTAEPHGNIARQVFTDKGPLAFLPLWEPNLCSIVWSTDTALAMSIETLPEEEFNKALGVAFDMKLGLCKRVSKLGRFPLKMRFARQFAASRLALIGDAAHTIHPLAGQGVNLGLLDAASLAQSLGALHQQGKDLGRYAHLRDYERWRKADAATMIAGMEGLKRIFGHVPAPIRVIRDAGMRAVDRLPALKQMFIQMALAGPGKLPELAKADPA